MRKLILALIESVLFTCVAQAQEPILDRITKLEQAAQQTNSRLTVLESKVNGLADKIDALSAKVDALKAPTVVKGDACADGSCAVFPGSRPYTISCSNQGCVSGNCWAQGCGAASVNGNQGCAACANGSCGARTFYYQGSSFDDGSSAERPRLFRRLFGRLRGGCGG